MAKLARSEGAKAARPAGPAMSGEEEARWPLVAAHLTQRAWDDGQPRSTSTLLFFEEDGMIKVCLNDRDEGRSVFLTGRGVLDALDTLELGLVEDNLTWRARKG